MNIFEMLILNIILISFPLFCYLLYIVANKNVSRREKDFLFDFVLVSSSFLLIHYGNYFENVLLSFFLGGTVFLALSKNRYLISLVLEGVVISSYYPDLKSLLYFSIFYFVFDIFVFLYHKHPWKRFSFFKIYLFLYSAALILWRFLFHQTGLGYSILLIGIFIIFMNLSLILLVQGEKVMKNHLEFQELQKEKQIRLSLFKITHEIKNPVAVCKAYLDMFDVDNVEHARKYVPIIQKEIERLLLLLQDFLLVNKSNMKYEIMDVNMLLEDVLKDIRPLMEEHQISFKVNTIDDELFISGDYNRLNQVFVNLLKNSIEANAKTIQLKTNLTSKILEVQIIDDGEGISSEILDKIKEPFYTTKPRGSGLGVSLSNEIIHAHSGKLEYQSKMGEGTSVKITLPLYVL